MGDDAAAVAREVARRREAGERVAGFVGTDAEAAAVMAEEMLGRLDELVAPDGGRVSPRRSS